MSDIEQPQLYTSLTPDDVERKNYTYVAVMVVDRQGKETHDAFLVPSPYKAEAAKLAKLYCIRHSLTLARWRAGGGGDYNECTCCHCFTLYPRNYIRKARRLYDDGKYL